ncbi:hypothetical protein I7I48_10596 [Histoplasma ohiense]|nr:hypothetical protein I7I48_10596 [Histoplasma ohiense (nom. inval.)]
MRNCSRKARSFDDGQVKREEKSSKRKEILFTSLHTTPGNQRIHQFHLIRKSITTRIQAI